MNEGLILDLKFDEIIDELLPGDYLHLSLSKILKLIRHKCITKVVSDLERDEIENTVLFSMYVKRSTIKILRIFQRFRHKN